MIRRCLELPSAASAEGAETAVASTGVGAAGGDTAEAVEPALPYEIQPPYEGPHEGLRSRQQNAFRQEEIERVLDRAKQVLLTQASLLELPASVMMMMIFYYCLSKRAPLLNTHTFTPVESELNTLGAALAASKPLLDGTDP
jgi:hypothetical protein